MIVLLIISVIINLVLGTILFLHPEKLTILRIEKKDKLEPWSDHDWAKLIFG